VTPQKGGDMKEEWVAPWGSGHQLPVGLPSMPNEKAKMPTELPLKRLVLESHPFVTAKTI
jgi:hypothetical protein